MEKGEVSEELKLVLVEKHPQYEVLKKQSDKLIEIGAHQELGKTKEEYQQELTKAISNFTYSKELEDQGLDEVVLVDYRLKPDFLLAKAKINSIINLKGCFNYQGVVTPTDQIKVIQTQSGPKYQGKKPNNVRDNLPPNERGLTLPEALHWANCQEDLTARLEICSIDIIGSVYPNSYVPYLCLDGDKPILSARFYNYARSYYGSASAGSEPGP